MASVTLSAPLPDWSALVADPTSQELVRRSRNLLKKIQPAIPGVHKACVTEPLQLNSENAEFGVMRSKINIPSAPVLKALSENFTLETGLQRVSEGLQLHQALLKSVSSHLEHRDKVDQLQMDIRDLIIQINKILNKVKGEAAAPPTAAPVSLRLPASYEVQVATHLTLVQLQSFTQDVVRLLRTLDLGSEEETES